MTNRAKLTSRLQQWKFVQAMQYADDKLTAEIRQVLVRLADLWGDTGFARGGVLETLIDYIVVKLVDDINALPE